MIALLADVPNRIGTERSREDQRLSEKPSLSQVRGISVRNFFSATGTHFRLHDVRYVLFLLSLKIEDGLSRRSCNAGHDEVPRKAASVRALRHIAIFAETPCADISVILSTRRPQSQPGT